MRKSKLRSRKRDLAENPTSLPVSQLKKQIENWLFDCQFRQHSPKIIGTRRVVLGKLLWFIERNSFEECGTSQLRQFFGHLTNGHKEKEGRWGNVKAKKAVRPLTVLMHYNHIRTFFAWLVTDGVLDCSPFERLSPPVERPYQIAALRWPNTTSPTRTTKATIL